MKTETVREAQQHLARLLAEVETGVETMLPRRGVEVAKLAPKDASVSCPEIKVDWDEYLETQKGRLPQIESGAVDADREGYRW